MEDFQTYCKPAYKCGICDSVYDNILDRATCELACIKKAEAEAKKAEEEKKQAEKAMRKEAVDEAIDNAWRLVDAYVNDYGHYEYGGEEKECDMHWPSRLWHKFLY